MDVLVHRIKILKFKLKIIDTNRLIYSSYQILIKKSNFIFFLKFFCYFLGQEKVA
jgi:hypothetical protein